tara:strand:- start:2578 stop:2718 length:141 start_codon:yes stop_codon:yes gene_type:complete
MTLKQLRESMSMEELYAWIGYFNLKVERQQKAQEQAERQAQHRRLR